MPFATGMPHFGSMKLHRTISAIFVLLYGIALVKPALPLVEYYFRMETYLQQCTNRERPELQCNGKCILVQKLKALRGESSAPTPPQPVKINLQEYPIGIIENVSLGEFATLRSYQAFKHCIRSTPCRFFSEIFHPPPIA